MEQQSKQQWVFWIGIGTSLVFLTIVVVGGILVLVAFLRGREQIPLTSPLANNFTPAEVRLSPLSSRASIETDDDPSVGPKDARVTIVEFSDFECPFCKQAFPIIRELMATYGDRVRFIYRDFPVATIHKNAQDAAEAGGCAHVQGKFWALHDKIFQYAPAIAAPDLKRYAQEAGLDTARFNACLDNGQFAAEVQQDFADGVAAGVRGTPTWFLNGRKVEGVIPRETFIQILDQLLAIPSQ